MDDVYVKFKKYRRDDALWSSFAIGEKLAELGRKPRRKPENKKLEKDETNKEESQFLFVATNLQRDLFSFVEFIPRISVAGPVLQQVEILSRIYEPVKKQGTLIKQREIFEIYKYPASEFDAINKKIHAFQSFSQAQRNLPHMLLIWLVAMYDSFIMQLLRAMFLSKPEILKSGKREISYSKLLEFENFEDATEYVIERETESVLRESHASQIEKISEYLGGVPLNKDLAIWPEFIEICERRNLLVHTDGIVSTQYLEVCKRHGCNLKNIEKGQKLGVSPKYLRRATAVMFEMGAKLLQVVWRKLEPSSNETADTMFIRLQYEAIRRQQFGLACALSDFAIKYIKNWKSERNRYIVIVNAANAYKKKKKITESDEILSAIDWTAAGEQFRICVAALRDDFEEVSRLMIRIGPNHPEIRAQEYREWPVFDGVRTNQKFRDTFQNVFGEPIFAENTDEIDTDSVSDTSGPNLRVIEGNKEKEN